MKLNLDCARDVLLAVESKEYGAVFKLDELARKLSVYDADEVAYACVKLKEAGYLQVVTAYTPCSHLPIVQGIRELTFNGHEFLANISDDGNWQKIREAAASAGSLALDVVAGIASNYIYAKLGLQ